MDQPRTVINLEETIGKQVGRRRPPTDPLRVAGKQVGRRRPPTDPLRVAGDLNELGTGLLAAAGHKMPRRGVYRFRTFEEADLWMTTMGRKES